MTFSHNQADFAKSGYTCSKSNRTKNSALAYINLFSFQMQQTKILNSKEINKHINH